MPELPLVVNLTIAPENEYFLKVESDTEEIELMSETVINGGGGGAPTYAGPYTATASTSGDVVLQTDGYLMNDDVTINQLDTLTVTSHTLSVNQDTGVVTATASLSQGYNDTASTSTGTLSLSTQAAATITPTTSSQTAVAKGKYTTGAVTVAAMPSGTAGTPTATKGTVSNHAISVTPSVTNVTGYITGGTKTGTAVSVSASELVSGNKAISSNGSNIDVTEYATVSVSVPNSYSAGDEGKVVSNGALVSQTSATYTSNNTYDTTTVSSVTVNVSGGGGDQTWFSSVGDLYTANMTIPSTISTYRFVREAFLNATNLETFILDWGTAALDASYGLFRGCTALETVWVSRPSFDNYCFYGCSALKNITLGRIGLAITSLMKQ